MGFWMILGRIAMSWFAGERKRRTMPQLELKLFSGAEAAEASEIFLIRPDVRPACPPDPEPSADSDCSGICARGEHMPELKSLHS